MFKREQEKVERQVLLDKLRKRELIQKEEQRRKQ